MWNAEINAFCHVTYCLTMGMFGWPFRGCSSATNRYDATFVGTARFWFGNVIGAGEWSVASCVNAQS